MRSITPSVRPTGSAGVGCAAARPNAARWPTGWWNRPLKLARPDLRLLAGLLDDVGKGWPGDHSVTGEVVARDVGRRMGLPAPDVELVASAVRLHLLLPMVATRRDLDDPVTVKQVASAV